MIPSYSLEKYFHKPWKIGEEKFYGKGDSSGFEIKYFDKESADKYGPNGYDLWWSTVGTVYPEELAEFIIETMNNRMLK